MANMNFGVNILPSSNNTYTLGNSNKKWNAYINQLNGKAIGTASEKNYDTQILEGSTSTNLPTSQAVANFVASMPKTISVLTNTSTPTLEFIIGTHNSSTSNLTGVLSTTDAISDGKIIFYLNPYALTTSEASLTLAYSNSGNSTSAIPIYSYGTQRLCTSFPAYTILILVYYINSCIFCK